jgi:asparagine synthase (glutamine-hydrolysing)
MTAICAALRFDGAPVPAAFLTPVLEALSGYGREVGVWAPNREAEPVALACRPWRVTPEDTRYRPPLRSADDRIVLVADARIDNRVELAEALNLRPEATAAWPDAAFILEGYQAWDRECCQRLLGDFAFILWDGRQRRLVAARDGVGQRVLFYHTSPRRIVLATSAQSIAALPDVERRLDQQKVADLLVLHQEPHHTFFEGIRRLPAGHTLTACPGDGGVTLERYWSPEPKRSIVRRSDDEYVEGFLEVFETAVRAHTRAAGQVGVMLSAGLDSSSVGAMAARVLSDSARGGALKAFHAAPRAGFEGRVRAGWVGDEAGDVEAIAALHPNVDLEILRPDGAGVMDAAVGFFQAIGAPMRNPSNLTWFEAVYEAAAARGVRVLLAGHAGNATISYGGLRSLRQWARQGRWLSVWRESRAHGRLTGQPPFRVLRDQVLRPLGSRLWAATAGSAGGDDSAPIWEANHSAIRPDFARAMGVEERLRAARRDLRFLDRADDLAVRVSILTGPADTTDAYSGFRSRYGIETRDPTADLRVVEYCLAIPSTQSFRDGYGRALVRRAMKGYLPDQVRLRRTRGAQGADWVTWFPSLRPAFQLELERLERSETAARCLDLPRLGQLLERWPSSFGVEHETDYKLLLLRGVLMGRFIRWFEETYG